MLLRETGFHSRCLSNKRLCVIICNSPHGTFSLFYYWNIRWFWSFCIIIPTLKAFHAAVCTQQLSEPAVLEQHGSQNISWRFQHASTKGSNVNHLSNILWWSNHCCRQWESSGYYWLQQGFWHCLPWNSPTQAVDVPLSSQVHMVVMSNTKPSWRPTLLVYPQKSTLGQCEWLVHQYQGHVAIQRDPDTLEKWPVRNLTKFNKWNYRVLYLWRNNLKDQGMLEGSLAGKDLKVLLDIKLNKKGQCYYSLH